MEFKPVNREWVKNAAIIFLVVLLVLTFFSNTIMNRTLPEAATAYVTSGTITAKVRGSGTVVASGLHEVKVKQTRDIRSVMIKVGQEVKAGDVLFVTGQGDSKELETAKETLRQLQVSYQKAAVGMPIIDHRDEEDAVYRMDQAYSDAVAKESQELLKIEDIKKTAGAIALEKGVEEAQKALDKANDDYNAFAGEDPSIRQTLADDVDICQQAYDNLMLNGGTEEELAVANYKLTQATAKLNEYDARGDTLYNAVIAAEETRSDRQSTYEAYVYPPSLQAAIAAREKAEEAYYSAVYALDNQKALDQQSLATSSIELQNIAAQIEIAQQKVKELSGEEGEQITANVSGVINSIGCTAGDTVTADTVLCTIEVPDMGHTLTFSVTNDQAQRLRVGDTATVSNFYWGSEIIAKLTTIRSDPKNPQTNKLLTFDLTGDVTTGSELTISVGQKSASYDLIVPNSSIRSDSNGSFVLRIEAKSSPLGNRYIARRVSVEVLASDDVNSAVTAALNNGDYVITTSSAPVGSGDQVRMADSDS